MMASLVNALARKCHFVRALAVLTEFERCRVAVHANDTNVWMALLSLRIWR